LLFKKNILCLQCISIVEKQRVREARTNIYINSLQLNIVFLYKYNNLLDKRKIKLFDYNSNLKINMLLITKISLIINSVKQVVKFIFILAIRRNNRKVVYISNVQLLKIFCKFKVNFIFEIDCNL